MLNTEKIIQFGNIVVALCSKVLITTTTTSKRTYGKNDGIYLRREDGLIDLFLTLLKGLVLFTCARFRNGSVDLTRLLQIELTAENLQIKHHQFWVYTKCSESLRKYCTILSVNMGILFIYNAQAIFRNQTVGPGVQIFNASQKNSRCDCKPWWQDFMLDPWYVWWLKLETSKQIRAMRFIYNIKGVSVFSCLEIIRGVQMHGYWMCIFSTKTCVFWKKGNARAGITCSIFYKWTYVKVYLELWFRMNMYLLCWEYVNPSRAVISKPFCRSAIYLMWENSS